MNKNEKVNRGIRIGSMLLDHFTMTAVAVIFFIPFIIFSFIKTYNISHDQVDGSYDGIFFCVSFIGFALYLCKDSVNGISVGKKITKLQVVHNITGEAASPIRCFIRNLFCIICPIEVVIAFLTPERRLGDYIAGTKIVVFIPQFLEKTKIQWNKAILPFLISYGIVILIASPLIQTVSYGQKVKRIESSYNDEASKYLEAYFTDNLGESMTISAKVFDKTDQPNIKFISIIYKPKINIFESETSEDHMYKVTDSLLFSIYPKETFVGQAFYIYNDRGRKHTTGREIGKLMEK